MNKKISLDKTRYFDHDADIGVIGRGETLEQAFIDGAVNTFAIMMDLSKVPLEQKVTIDFIEQDLEFAFVTWINTLLAQARIHKLVFAKFNLTHSQDHWQGEAIGSSWNEDLDRGVEVKGATLTGLSVVKLDQGWVVKCVVDV